MKRPTWALNSACAWRGIAEHGYHIPGIRSAAADVLKAGAKAPALRIVAKRVAIGVRGVTRTD